MAANLMPDDFVFTGWTPQPLDKGQLLALQAALLMAMPDYTYNLSDLRAEGDGVEAFIRITGTQMNPLDLSLFGIPPIETTGPTISLPQMPARFVVENDQVARMSVQSVPGGGIEGLLQQVAGELPSVPRFKS